MKEKTARQKFKIGDKVVQNREWMKSNTIPVQIKSGVVAGFIKGSRNIVRITCDGESIIQEWSSRFWDKVPSKFWAKFPSESQTNDTRVTATSLFIDNTDIGSSVLRLRTPVATNLHRICQLKLRVINMWQRFRKMLVL